VPTFWGIKLNDVVAERRVADLEWKDSVDKKMEEGQRTFDRILAELKHNTEETKAVKAQLSEHVEQYQEFADTMKPVADTIRTLEPGIKVAGQVGNGLAWLAKWIRRSIIWITPVAMFAAGVWQAIKHWPEVK
jgi:hypothetical protein